MLQHTCNDGRVFVPELLSLSVLGVVAYLTIEERTKLTVFGRNLCLTYLDSI